MSWAPYEYWSEKKYAPRRKPSGKEGGYGDYNWEELYKSGNLKKLKVAEFNKYIFRHNLSRRKMSKSEKLTFCHFTSAKGYVKAGILTLRCCWNYSNGRFGHPVRRWWYKCQWGLRKWRLTTTGIWGCKQLWRKWFKGQWKWRGRRVAWRGQDKLL